MIYFKLDSSSGLRVMISGSYEINIIQTQNSGSDAGVGA